MKFNEHSAKVNWYPGTTKQALEDGFERVTNGTDPFAYSNRNPYSQGWRDAPAPVLGLDEDEDNC